MSERGVLQSRTPRTCGTCYSIKKKYIYLSLKSRRVRGVRDLWDLLFYEKIYFYIKRCVCFSLRVDKSGESGTCGTCSGIIIESYLNHELTQVGAWSPKLPLGSVALGCLHALLQVFRTSLCMTTCLTAQSVERPHSVAQHHLCSPLRFGLRLSSHAWSRIEHHTDTTKPTTGGKCSQSFHRNGYVGTLTLDSKLHRQLPRRMRKSRTQGVNKRSTHN